MSSQKERGAVSPPKRGGSRGGSIRGQQSPPIRGGRGGRDKAISKQKLKKSVVVIASESEEEEEESKQVEGEVDSSDSDVMMHQSSSSQKGGSSQQSSSGVELASPIGRMMPLKQVQDDYQRFSQMRVRGSSTVGVDSSLTNAGTEVYAVDIKWIEQWRAAATSLPGQSAKQFLSQTSSFVEKAGNSSIASLAAAQSNLTASGGLGSEVFVEYLSNQRIVVPKSSILCCGDERNPYNNIIREDMQTGKDFQLISKEQWALLEANYSVKPQSLGFIGNQQAPLYPIRRFYEKIGMGIRTFPDVHYHKFELSFFLPFQKQQGKEHIKLTQLYQTYFSKRRTWEEFKLRMVKIMKENPEISQLIKANRTGGYVTKDEIKVWSISMGQLEQIRQFIANLQQRKQQQNGTRRQDQQLQLNQLSFEVQGYCFDKFGNHQIEPMVVMQKKGGNIENTQINNEKDIILIEVCESTEKHFILKSSVNEEQLEICGQCQYCFKVKQLSIHCKCMSVSYCCLNCQINDLKFHQEKCSAMETIEDWDTICVKSPNARMGLTGLKNLKNSCYMSSSIQCLSHAIGLTNYFLLGHFKEELNYKNPLGAKGQLAIAYGKLLKQLWYDDKPYLAPWQFKKTIGKFASHFNNFDQQDSQELLNFMLDGLHEDLNRVQHKPIIPQIESEGLDDEKDSEESWQNHLKRNQSIIVDLMHGQFKSTVKCPDCDKLSITFDPFMSVSLPIPEIKIVEKSYYWVPYDTSKKCVQDSFKFKSLEQIKTLRKFIANSFDVNQEQFELVVIQEDAVRRILPRYEQVSSLNVNNIFIFAMETSPEAFQGQNSSTTRTQQNMVSPEEKPMIVQGQGGLTVPQQLQQEDGRTSFAISSAINIQIMNDQWNEKKGANELSKKLKTNFIQVIVNFEYYKAPSCYDEEPEKFFPRLLYLKLEDSLIQAHLDIFEFLKPLFTQYLEHKGGVSTQSMKVYKQRKNVNVPDRINCSVWKNMTLNQQYEAVFGPLDPSRKKLEDLPYLISILTRSNNSPEMKGKCVYCKRDQCQNCPLPFEDISLRQYLNDAGVSTQSYFYYEDHQHKQLVATANKIDKKKPFLQNTPSKKQFNNLEFELQISINANKCWALYENLVRSKLYSKVYPDKAAERQSQFHNDKVMIDDCFRQFMTPEKLSHQNTWFCSKCKMHKQAVKKIQIFRTPPILIINLKRFKGMQQKQNTAVHFPLDGLDMSNLIISQKQKDSEPLIYDLFGVSNHYGQLLGGHYTAYAKNDGAWYRFNDDVVEEIENQNQIVSSAAYNLFYARRDIDFSNLDYAAIKNTLRTNGDQFSSAILYTHPVYTTRQSPPLISHRQITNTLTHSSIIQLQNAHSSNSSSQQEDDEEMKLVERNDSNLELQVASRHASSTIIKLTPKHWSQSNHESQNYSQRILARPESELSMNFNNFQRSAQMKAQLLQSSQLPELITDKNVALKDEGESQVQSSHSLKSRKRSRSRSLDEKLQ